MLQQSMQDIAVISQSGNYIFILCSLVLAGLSVYFCAVYNSGIVVKCDNWWRYRMECDTVANCDSDFTEFGECTYELATDSAYTTCFLLATELFLLLSRKYYGIDGPRMIVVECIIRLIWFIVLTSVIAPTLNTDLIGRTADQIDKIFNCECIQESSFFFSSDDTDGMDIYHQRINDFQVLSLFIVIFGVCLALFTIAILVLFFQSPDLPKIKKEIKQEQQTQKKIQTVIKETRYANWISATELAQLNQGTSIAVTPAAPPAASASAGAIAKPADAQGVDLQVGAVQQPSLGAEGSTSAGKSGVGLSEAISQGKHKVSWGISTSFWFPFGLCCVARVSCTAIFGAIVTPIACVANFIEAYYSSTKKYLDNSITNIVNLHQKLIELQNAAPSIQFHARCYHWETRTRTVYYTDANGNRQSRIETYQEQVVTHTAVESYLFGSWRDVSPDVSKYNLDEYNLTKLKLTQHYCFKDDNTSNDFNGKYDSFCKANKFDIYQNYWKTMHIDGFDDKFLASLDDTVLPQCMNALWFWFWTVFVCSPCFRVWMDASVGNKQYHIVKEISLY